MFNCSTKRLPSRVSCGRRPCLQQLFILVCVIIVCPVLSAECSCEYGNSLWQCDFPVDCNALVSKNNALYGTIPSSLGSMTSLSILDIIANDLSGTIPPSIGSLTNLMSLWIKNNDLSGTIPSSLGSLTRLSDFQAAGTELTGSFPESMCHLQDSLDNIFFCDTEPYLVNNCTGGCDYSFPDNNPDETASCGLQSCDGDQQLKQLIGTGILVGIGIVIVVVLAVVATILISQQIKKKRQIAAKRKVETDGILAKFLGNEAVNHLNALPKKWRHQLCPKEDLDKSMILLQTSAEYLDDKNNGIEKCRLFAKSTKAYENDLKKELRDCFNTRIELYSKALQEIPAAKHQIAALVHLVNKDSHQKYDPVFRQAVKKFPSVQEQVKSWVGTLYNTDRLCPERAKQPFTDLFKVLQNAREVKPRFDTYFDNIAQELKATYYKKHGKYLSLKHIFRICEKISFNFKQTDRFDAASVCDIVRGSILCDTLDGMLQCAKHVSNLPDIELLKCKDRINNPTSGGWRDIVFLGKFRDNDHVFELQIHLKSLFDLRSATQSYHKNNASGHRLYEISRSLLEALEVALPEKLIISLLEQHVDSTRSQNSQSSNDTTFKPSNTANSSRKVVPLEVITSKHESTKAQKSFVQPKILRLDHYKM